MYQCRPEEFDIKSYTTNILRGALKGLNVPFFLPASVTQDMRLNIINNACSQGVQLRWGIIVKELKEVMISELR